MPRNTLFQRIILPGLVMQSVMIGGGYATGRELVEFFLSNGPLGGLLGMLTAIAGISLISAIGFEFARLTCSYDYRSFFRGLLGRGWFLFEIGYFMLALLVLAVLGAASGELVVTHLGIGAPVGVVGMMLLIGLLVILFCVRHMESRRDALTAGALCGPLAMIPAVLFFLGMAASYPEIVAAPVPSDFMIQALELRWIEIVFYLVVFGTFVETGTATIHAINERLSQTWSERGRALPRWLRPVVAAAALIIAIVLAGQFGLIDLVARGYGTLTWFFIAIFVVPLSTLGVWRIWKSR